MKPNWIAKALCGIALLTVFKTVAEKAVDTSSDETRLVVLAPHLVEILFSLGLGEQIVASSDFAEKPLAAKEIERVADAFYINIERILAIKPDAVLVWQGGTPSAHIQQLERFNIPIITSTITKPSDMPNEIRRLGGLLGVQNKAVKTANQYQQTLDAVKEKYLKKKPLSIFYLISQKPLMTATYNAWPNLLLSYCNASNIIQGSTSDYPLVNDEVFLSLSPDVIVVPVSDGAGQPPLRKLFADSNVISINADAFHQMTVSGIETLSKTCESLHSTR